LNFWRQPRTGVAHRGMSSVSRLIGYDQQFPRLFFAGSDHGFHGVEDQIEDHLLQLYPIAFDDRQVLGELRPERTPFFIASLRVIRKGVKS
jgi:hypothetical protein